MPGRTQPYDGWYAAGMCRSIKTLRRKDQPATPDEIEAAALQFVRKISGYRVPSKKNQEAFDAAVEEITAASRRLLEAVGEVLPEGSAAAG